MEAASFSTVRQAFWLLCQKDTAGGPFAGLHAPMKYKPG